MCVHICLEVRSQYLSPKLSILLRQDLSLSPELTSSLGIHLPLISPILTGVTNMHCHLALYVGDGNLDLSHHAFKTRTLSTVLASFMPT